jgi:hypothetical protein
VLQTAHDHMVARFKKPRRAVQSGRHTGRKI